MGGNVRKCQKCQRVSGGVRVTNQSVVHLGRGTCISVHTTVLGSDLPCFQCTPPVEIWVSIYSCGSVPVHLVSFIHRMPCCALSAETSSVACHAVLCLLKHWPRRVAHDMLRFSMAHAQWYTLIWHVCKVCTCFCSRLMHVQERRRRTLYRIVHCVQEWTLFLSQCTTTSIRILFIWVWRHLVAFLRFQLHMFWLEQRHFQSDLHKEKTTKLYNIYISFCSMKPYSKIVIWGCFAQCKLSRPHSHLHFFWRRQWSNKHNHAHNSVLYLT